MKTSRGGLTIDFSVSVRHLLMRRIEVTTMDPNNVDDQDDMPRKDRNENEEFVPGPLDEPSEAHDSNESIEDLEDDEDKDIEEGID